MKEPAGEMSTPGPVTVFLPEDRALFRFFLVFEAEPLLRADFFVVAVFFELARWMVILGIVVDTAKGSIAESCGAGDVFLAYPGLNAITKQTAVTTP